MKTFLATILLGLLTISPKLAFSQRGKDLDYAVPAANTVVNTYTYLTANSTPTTLTVNSNTMTGGAFGAVPLAAGDLIMIIQMQGATIDVNTTPTASWGGHYTVPNIYMTTGFYINPYEWGQITAYNNAGKFEQVEVQSVSGANTITVNCNLQNTYTSSGHVQVIRVPRFNNLTFNVNSSLVPTAWNGNTGGVLAVEVKGNIVFNTNSKFTASGKGFREGTVGGVGNTGSNTPYTNDAPGNGDSYLGSDLNAEGARKGEGIAGYTTEYALLYSIFGRGAPANGGGGAGYQNSGGGGGSNVGSIANYTGKGVPTGTYPNAVWNLEAAGFGGSSSPGGGRGGYSYSTVNNDATVVGFGPNKAAWNGNARKENGGFGGHPLAYDATRLFMGGGGGSGDQDSGQGGAGAVGGGIVYITCYGAISGTGNIESDGAIGMNTNPTNQAVSAFPSSTNKKGNDGAGGGGGGGSVYIKNSTAIPATVTINARGGNGGNQVLTIGAGAAAEASGPGGGGGGGNIAFTSGTPVQVVTGGISGTTNSTQLTEFTVNGATNGAAGVASLASSIFNITAANTTICAGATSTLTAVVTGVLPGTLTWYSQAYGGASLGTGTTFTTPVLAVTTTYYVGVCPGTFRVPVTVTVNPKPVIAGVAVLTNPTCSAAGSITGLTVSGGTVPYAYSWSGTSTPGMDYTNVGAGTYTLTVTDFNGCTDTDGPHTLVGVSGPIINATGIVITNQNCNGTMGSISGITATGTGLVYSWSSSGGSALNASNLSANSYTLTVTDGNGCTATSGPYSVTFIAGPSINAAGITITSATCGNANGAINGITASGTATLTYAWNGSATASANLTGQLGGNNNLVVTDGNGCTASAGPFTIPSVAGPTINAGAVVLTNENCGLGNGSITGLSISGGTPSYVLSWSNTAQTTLNLSNLTANSYTLTVTDQNLCTATSGPYSITNSSGPVVTTSGVALQDQLCNGTMGSISGITATGTGLIYSWSNGGGSALNASNLVAGNYTLTVTDGAGCTAMAGPYAINYVTGPTLNATGIVITNSTCGNSNGAISGLTAAGTGLTYTWNGAASASLNISNQLAANYSLVVSDVNGCTVNGGPYTISNVSGPTISATSMVISPENCNQLDGGITGITVSGGTPAYAISWSGTAQTTLDISNLSAGNYSLTVTDFNNCATTAGPYAVTNAGGPVINELSAVTTNETCIGGLGSVTGITATGTGLIYSWSNGGGSSLNASNLNAGTYALTVTDGNGCIATSSNYVVNLPSVIVIDTTNIVITLTSCIANTGSISGITYSGGTPPVSILWSNLASTLNINNLAFGDYTLIVNDATGCADTVTVTVNMLNAPIIDTNAMVTTVESCGQNNGSISGITYTGGTPAFTYEWNNNPSLNTLNLAGLTAGVYSLVVTDFEGCQDQVSITILETVPSPIDGSAIVISGVSCLTPGSISGITVGGTGPFTYAWTNTTQTTLDINNLTVGSYTLSVTNGNGCVSTYGPVVVPQIAPPVAAFTWDPISPDVNQTVDFLNGSTGIAPLVSTWTILGINTVSTNAQSSFGTEGQYLVSISVTDANGCIDTLTQIITIYGTLEIPNVITANTDNTNDAFEVKGLKPNTQLIILNRWGNIVFKTDNYLNDWKGKDISGVDLLEGVYTYVLVTPDEQTKHGFIHLIR